MQMSSNITCIKCDRLRSDCLTAVCKAFPSGIPIDIIEEGFNHKKPFPGDNGIRFEPIKVQKTKG